MYVTSARYGLVVDEADMDSSLADLAVGLSRRLTHALAEDVTTAISEALRDVAGATHLESCQLLEFTASGSDPRVYLPALAMNALHVADGPPSTPSWLSERLARGEIVCSSGPDEPQLATLVRREHGSGACSVLGVPATFNGQVVCALLLDGGPVPRHWSPSLVGRMQLLSEILGAALQRERQENTLRANVAMIEGLNAQLKAENVYLKEELQTYHDFDEIVGECGPFRHALNRLSQVAPMKSTVLLLGETGTGKELFARVLHERSRRSARPLVRVNCAALPPTLVESELFGHEKGAFTGAVTTRQGRFELADGGTIFLDEIGDLPNDLQVKFLRVLQEGEFERVGSSRTRKVDVRIIAATHRDLEAAASAGTFRADLFYRLSVYPIRLPALRERAEDIPRLVWFFIHRHQRDLGRSISKVPQSVMSALQHYAWPGNVRELENVVERAMIASTGDTLRLDGPLAFDRPIKMRGEGGDNLDAVQRAHIEAVLERCGWRINGSGNAAERLGIHPNTLRFRMKKLNVVPPEGRSRLRRSAEDE